MNETNPIADNGLQVFNNRMFGELRTYTDEQGKTMFCLADLCKSLALNNSRQVKMRLDTRGTRIINFNQEGVINNDGIIAGNPNATFIDEPNLYRCIFQSRKKRAQMFQDWVFDEVLPSIRKTGGYMAAKQDDTPEEIMARALAIAQETLARRENRIAQLEAESRQHQAQIESKDETIHQQTEEIKKQAPKVSYYDDVLQSVNTLTSTQVAKSLGIEVRCLNKKLQEAGVIYRQSGMWMLKSPYSGWRMSATRTQTFTRSDGTTGTSSYTVWTERGRRFIVALSENGWNVRNAVKAIKGEKGGEA